MRLTPGTRLGGYEVVEGIGAGGMGEVYRAHDTSLHRDVAIKLVHPDFCGHPDSLLRLRREARALAALNHPHVATLHELAEFGDSCGLVMELVSGETLADRLRRRALSIEDTLRLGAQIAAALDAAHESGIVHRDLKPANIKITDHGTVKVLDFGLAKASVDPADAVAGSTLATASGTLLGTIPYMSPEQARGAPIDRRTDLWALGCVLFEMLTGRPAFDGGSAPDILVAILEKEPDWSALPRDTPPTLQRLLRRCLQKDPRKRFRDAADAQLELEDAAGDPAGAAGMPPTGGRSLLRVALLMAGGVTIGATAAWLWRAPSGSPANEVQFAIALPDDQRLALTTLGAVAMSPDGRVVVHVAGRGNTTQLVLRTLDSPTSTALAGTFGAVSPFFSPDGAWIGFFADAKLKKVAVGGGAPITLCDAGDGLGGTWSTDGSIVFASATGSPLQRVPANGGTPARATELDAARGEFSHRWPEFLPDGQTILFTVGTVGEWDDAEIVAQSLTTGKRTPVLTGGTNPRYLAAGFLAYAHDGAIWTASFDARRLELRGPPQRALDAVESSADGAAQFAVSRTGASVYLPAALSLTARRLVVVDGDERTPLAAPLHSYVTPRVSPDGRRVLLGVADEAEHIWSYDVGVGTLTQLTFEAANRAPIWSADGQRITFASNRNGALNLFAAAAQADAPGERLATSDFLQVPGSWSPDGQVLAFMEQHPSTGRDIWLLRRNGERVAFANTAANESAPRFSPDGRWIAYVSDETGDPAVYLRPAQGTTPARRVSKATGLEPVWSRDGGVLFYREDERLIAVPILGSGATGGARVILSGEAEAGSFDAAGYDTMAGANRLLIITRASPSTTPSELRVILNWSPGSAR